ncbi:MAG: single-stranded-DNA-specific exonuclease RecJ [Dehalococcoidia bacterium]|nr:single-stranded-DNA-specific exonuclease RecJ [Dehalococcoidia bacterium]
MLPCQHQLTNTYGLESPSSPRATTLGLALNSSLNPQSTPLVTSGQKAWRVRLAVPVEVRSALGRAGYHPLLVQLLYNRGVANAPQAQAFLSTEPVSHDPLALPGMSAAVQRLRQALERREKVAVFGDFDVDGVSATALMARALKPLGCEVIPYIPHRVNEGHGLTLPAVRTLAEAGTNLLITVDCGITSHEEIIAAAELGIDTIVTDHHLVPEGPPPACAVVDPLLPDSQYPFPHLTGAGLAWKLAQALYHSLGKQDGEWQRPLLSLAALGTVADVAPLLDENRSIVRQGALEMGKSSISGLRALIRSARIEARAVDSETIAWILAPRLNAAGRIDSASVSYDLLVEESDEKAAALAAILEEQNRERQRLTGESLEKARTLVKMAPLLMVGDPSFSPGIIGLVAGRLVEEFSRPAVVVSLGQDVCRGSCRSTPEFDIGAALHRVAPAIGGFIRYGGHPQAAGFSVATEKLPLLAEHLVALARETLGEEVLQPHRNIDMELALSGLPRDIYRLIQGLAPFGAGNPAPVFLSRNVQVVDAHPMGAGGEHLRLKLRDNGVGWDAVAFRQSASLPANAQAIDVVYAVEMDRWNGHDTLRLNVLDMRAAGRIT